MSSQEYYGEGRPPQDSYRGYGGYGQQQYPNQSQYGGQQPEYSQRPYSEEQKHPGPHAYGHYSYDGPSNEPYSQNYSQGPRPHSPYDGGYNQPPPPTGSYNEGYGNESSQYSQPPRQDYSGPPPNYGHQQSTYQYESGQNQGGYSYESNQYQSTYQEGPPPEGQGEEGERGFLGAMAGGAAGAFGGHKVHHGVLGTIGGAVAGSMLEDQYKKHKKEKQQEAQLQQQMHQPQHHLGGAPIPPRVPSPGGNNFAGNFSASSTQISLDRDYDLIASCKDRHGEHRLSSVSLNDCLGNSFGNFSWSKGGDFGASARNVRLVEGGRVLEAELGAGDGSFKRARVRLDERIENWDGELRFIER